MPRQKIRLEHRMCEMVCNGQIDIATAQEAFATDWIAAYQKYFEGGRRGKMAPTAAPVTTPSAPTDFQPQRRLRPIAPPIRLCGSI